VEVKGPRRGPVPMNGEGGPGASDWEGGPMSLKKVSDQRKFTDAGS